MCLFVHKSYHPGINPSPAISRKDKHVYKIILRNENEYITPYQHTQLIFTDDISVLCAQLKSRKYRSYTIISEGIHAYRSRQKALFLGALILVEDKNIIFCDAIIPKGTKYFMGQNGNIVAEKLIIFRTEEAFKNYILKK